MQVWQKTLALAGGGMVIGTLAGFTLDPAMKPPPDPPWRSAYTTPSDPYRIVESGPSDLAPPNWYDDPVDARVVRYEPYAPVFAQLEPLPMPDPLPEEDIPAPGDPIEPHAATEGRAFAIAMEAESAADDARAIEAAAAPAASEPEIRPALTDEPATAPAEAL